jgi:hypothetical protein
MPRTHVQIKITNTAIRLATSTAAFSIDTLINMHSLTSCTRTATQHWSAQQLVAALVQLALVHQDVAFACAQQCHSQQRIFCRSCITYALVRNGLTANTYTGHCGSAAVTLDAAFALRRRLELNFFFHRPLGERIMPPNAAVCERRSRSALID